MRELVVCDDCGEIIPWLDGDISWAGNLDGGLGVALSGGYGEFIDPMENQGSIAFSLCAACAKKFVEANPWVAKMVGDNINCNIGHVCGSRGLVFEPMSSCSVDVLRHGWLSCYVGTWDGKVAWAWKADALAGPTKALLANLGAVDGLVGYGPVDPDDGPSVHWVPDEESFSGNILVAGY